MPRSRRGRGESGIRYREPIPARNGRPARKGVWVATVSQGIDRKTGKRLRTFLYAPTKEQAQAKLLKFLTESGGTRARVTERVKLADYLIRWLEGVRATKSANTARSYEQIVRLHILPHVGSVRLDAFTAADAERLYRDVRNAGASVAMAAKLHAVLRIALNHAKRRGLIATSPLETITPPRHRRPPVTALTVEQVAALLKAARGHRLEALFVLAVLHGMRQGELFALRWDDVDFPNRTLSVTRSVQEISGALTVVEPKSARSRRRIELSKMAVEALRRRKALADREKDDSGYVFTSTRGELLRKSNFLRREWFPLRETAKLPESVRFHDLRHTSASLLLLQGTSPKVVQELLGHADVRLTLDTYSHVLPGLQRQAADALDALLAAKGRRSKQASRSRKG